MGFVQCPKFKQHDYCKKYPELMKIQCNKSCFCGKDLPAADAARQAPVTPPPAPIAAAPAAPVPPAPKDGATTATKEDFDAADKVNVDNVFLVVGAKNVPNNESVAITDITGKEMESEEPEKEEPEEEEEEEESDDEDDRGSGKKAPVAKSDMFGSGSGEEDMKKEILKTLIAITP